MDPKTYKFDTLSLHGGHQPDKNFGSRAVPIYQTTSYVFQDTDHAAALFNLEQGGHIYSRISNPTVAVLEERVSALEGGTGAIATASGQSAVFLSLMTLLNSGDHIVSSSQLYGGTVNLLRLTLPRFGIETTFVKPRDTEEFKKSIKSNTKLIFGEIIDYCKENMAGFKRPKHVIFGELPKTSTGKIQKFELRKKAKEI